MKVIVGSDHAGFAHKCKIVRLLEELGHDVVDVGTTNEESVDYPDFAVKVAESVARGDSDRGILVCATGIGMSIAANRIKGVRAALCYSEEVAELSRRHNDSNVMCLGGRFMPWESVSRMVRKWMQTPFEGGRHARRVCKLDNI